MSNLDTIAKLYKTIKSKKGADPTISYTAKLFKKGKRKVAQKVGEEAVETVIASVSGKKKHTIEESADLLYHLHVLWAMMEIKPQDVMKELERRMGTSGITEKNSRKTD